MPQPPALDEDLDRRLSSLYRRWHALEKGLGAKGGLVIDFAMDPSPDAGEAPYSDRLAVLRDLDRLQADVAAGSGAPNPAWLKARLAGSAAYLRALLGERRDFASYLSATMGIRPHRVPDEVLRERAARLAQRFADRGIAWGPEGRAAFRERFVSTDVPGICRELRETATLLVERLRSILEDVPEPTYRIELAREDAYWSNWIDGNIEDGVTLKVNTHPRIEYRKTSALSLAAHEIAGHAVHVGCMRRTAGEGGMPKGALNLTVHACDAFQMEGLAQVVLHAFDREGLLPEGHLSEDHQLLEDYRAQSGDAMGNAQLLLEDGASLEEVWAEAKRWCPMTSRMALARGLRDRGTSPLYRSYIHVYAPSRRLLLQAVALPEAQRREVLGHTYRELWTPGQLAALIAGEDADAVRQQDPPPPEV